MVQHKAQLKKQQKRGVDFKKIKRKIGRKLPPPKNTTNTEVKSKAIILPEQSLASEKGGLAVSKKGLTLKELLQQTCHHNAKVRRDALMGIRDIFVKHPQELKMHRLSVIEKLRERMTDDDKMVRETLFQLLKAVVFPACINMDNQGTFISLTMAYVFNAMTHLAFDVRLMAFKFFDLVVHHYPISFSMYAEKMIQQYKEVLQKNQFNLHDKGKLKSVLAGLAYCLSLLPSSTHQNVVPHPRVLHAFESEVHEDRSVFSVTAKELMGLLPILVGGLQDFMPMPSLETQSFDCVLSILKSIHLVVKFLVFGNGPPSNQTRDQDVLQLLLKKLFAVFPLNRTHQSSEKEDNRFFILNVIVAEIYLCLSDWCGPLEKFLVFIVDALSDKSGKSFFQKHSLPLIPFIPKLTMQVDHTWKSHILEAFTEVFNKCEPESSMKLVCLSAIEEMLFPESIRDSAEIVEFQIRWIREIPLLLTALGDKNPCSTKAVLRVMLHLGQWGISNSRLSQEVDSMQLSLTHFYATCHDHGEITYGPFMKHTREIQELSLSGLYYLSFLHPSLLQSLAACCLCGDLEPFVLLRILEVVNCAYRAGHIHIPDYISFLITLLSRYPVPKCGLFRSVTSDVCCWVSQIGDHHLVFRLVEGPLVHQISNKAAAEVELENTCALLRMIMTLDSDPTRLSEDSISKLANILPGYLIRASSIQQKVGEEDYYVLPCLVLFGRSERALREVMASFVSECQKPHRVTAVAGVILVMHRHQLLSLSSCKQEIASICHNILTLISDEGYTLKIQDKHQMQCAYDRLNNIQI